MDIEQLKLIIEMLQGVGEGVKDITLLYLWLAFAGNLIGVLTVIGVTSVVAYFISKTVREANGYGLHETFLREMRDLLGTGTRGPLTGDELHRTLEALRRLARDSVEKSND
jgi:hypothetical protein